MTPHALNANSPRTMLNKVPEVTAIFWIIKVLATTVGETFADFLNVQLNFGLTLTSIVMAAALAVALVVQFRLRRYVPAVYWLAVVLISVVGTLITDNLSDNLGVPLWVTTVVFASAIALVALAYFAFRLNAVLAFWIAYILTRPLGASTGDLLSQPVRDGGLGLGTTGTSALFLAVILVLVTLLSLRRRTSVGPGSAELVS